MKKRILAVLALVVILCAVPCYGQVAAGTPPYASFTGGPDAINLGNLNTHIAIPVLSKAGRGMSFSYNLSYDSSIWDPVASGSTKVWEPTTTGLGWTMASIGGGYVTYKEKTSTNTCLEGKLQGTETTYTYQDWTYNDGTGTAHVFPGVTFYSTGCYTEGPSTLASTASDGSGFLINATGSTVNSVTATDGTISYLGIGGVLLQDRNGNQITISGDNYYDTTSSTTPVLVQSGSGLPSSPLKFTYSAPSGASASFQVIYSAYTLQTNFGCSGITEYGPTAVNLVSEVELPDRTSYSFTYEPTPGNSGSVTGRIASVKLPTGGTISYTYTGGSNGIECVDGSTAGMTRVTPDGTWTYARSGSGSAWSTTITDPASPNNQSVVNFQQEATTHNFYETEHEVYEGSTSGTLLKTVYTCYNGAAVPCNSTAITLPIAQKNVYTVWPGGMESETAASYSSTGLITERDEHGYGNGSPGSITRKTLRTYASLGNNITGMPATVTIEDGSGNVKAQTTYSYDQNGLESINGTPQHVSVSGSRGNVTFKSMLVQGSTTLSWGYSYYDTGNVLTSTDPAGDGGAFNFANCGYAYPSTVSLGILNGTATWNCTGGVATSAKDSNGNTTSYDYTTDPYFWRPDSLTDQESNVTNLTFTGQNVSEASLIFNNGTSGEVVLSTLDSLGRKYIDQIKESPSSSTYDSVETTYDSSGRKDFVSLPYPAAAGQPCTGSCPGTSISYDGLGRKTKVSDSGGSSTTYGYIQNDVYETRGPAPTGENTKRKQYEYDGLGRLTSVCEITSATGSGTCGQSTPQTGYWTTYTYDILDHIISVTQNAQSSSQKQTRSFSYDGFGRLTSETNPESGTTTYTYDTDSTCGTSKGDRVKKIDAVGNVTCFSYDGQHRLTRTYVSSGAYASTTPYKYIVYDSATVNGVSMANAIGRIAEAYTSNSACPSPCSSKLTDEGFSYTPRGEVSDTYESTPNSGNYFHVNETYWPNGALNSLSAQYGTNSIAGLPTFTYGVDGEGRIYSVSASSGQSPLSSTSYSTASLPIQVNLGSSDADIFTYDPNTDRMTKYNFTINGQSVVGQLTWNDIGTLETLAITDPFNSADNQTCNYTHDDLTRIATVNCGSPWTQSITYDAFGNLSKSGSSSFQPTYSYLSNHMTEIGSSTPSYDANGNVTNDFLHTYQWDAAGRPIVIDAGDPDGVDLTYDALGRMVEQDHQGTYEQIVYAPSGFKLALMYGQSLFRAFVPLTGGATAVYNSNGLDYYRHSDWIGSSRFASTPSRTLYYDGAYAPFGESYSESGTTDRSFTGTNQDTVSALYDFAAREYGIQGRWPSPDPAGLSSVTPFDPRTWNRYAYVRNNPLQLTDPAGTCDPDCGANGGGCDNVDCPNGTFTGNPYCDSFCLSFYCPPEYAMCGPYGTGSTPSAAGGGAGGGGGGGLGGGLSDILGQYTVFLFGGVPIFVNSFNTFSSDPSNPPLTFSDGAIYTTDQYGNPILVGIYAYVPNPNDYSWTLSFMIPLEPIMIGRVPIGDLAVAGSVTSIPSQNEVCASVGVGLQFPPAGKSFSIGPLTNGNLTNVASVESGGSWSVGGILPGFFGWGMSTNSSGTVSGPTFGTPGLGWSYTSGGCTNVD